MLPPNPRPNDLRSTWFQRATPSFLSRTCVCGSHTDLLNTDVAPTEHDPNVTSVSLDQGAPRHLRTVRMGELDLDLLQEWINEYADLRLELAHWRDQLVELSLCDYLSRVTLHPIVAQADPAVGE